MNYISIPIATLIFTAGYFGEFITFCNLYLLRCKHNFSLPTNYFSRLQKRHEIPQTYPILLDGLVTAQNSAIPYQPQSIVDGEGNEKVHVKRYPSTLQGSENVKVV